MTAETLDLTCTDCGVSIAESEMDEPCADCGSKARTFNVTIEEGLGVSDFWDSRLINPQLPSEDKLRVHSQTGMQFSVDLGRLVRKDRLIDKDNDRYMEKIVDPLSGHVIRYCEESLKAHQGHGSAKPNSPRLRVTVMIRIPHRIHHRPCRINVPVHLQVAVHGDLRGIQRHLWRLDHHGRSRFNAHAPSAFE